MAQPPHLPHIFVSHSHHDNDFGIQLVVDLKRALGDPDAVWYDKAGGLRGGDAWWRKIVEEITARDTFVVILSPDAVASEWVTDEIDIAWQQKNATGKLIIPVLYQPCTVRQDLNTRQIISFVAPRPYEEAFAELCAALGLDLELAAHVAALPQASTTSTSASAQDSSAVSAQQRQAQQVQQSALRPALYPMGSLISTTSTDRTVDWNQGMVLVDIRNAAVGDALNIFGPLFAPKPVDPILGNRFTLWQSPPIPPGQETKVAFHIGMTQIDGDTQIGPYTFYPPPRPTPTESWNQGIQVVLARLILTYHDVFGTKHASISDFTDQHGWKHLEFLSSIDWDIEELDRLARAP